jgi:hypothetical protein
MRDKILVEAGKVLDELVAEDVMGWTDTGEEESMAYGIFKTRHKNERGKYKSVPNFSTEISAAWEVLEKFEEYEIRKYVSAANEFMFECNIVIKEKKVYAIDKNKELAICKCAILAVMNI